MTDSRGRGIQVKYSPGSTNWEKLIVDLQEGTASFSGSSTVTSLSIDQETTVFSQPSAYKKRSGIGTMMVDELHFAEPNFSTGSTIETFVDYKKPGIIAATSGGFPLLADFNVSSRFNYYGQTTDSYFVRKWRQN